MKQKIKKVYENSKQKANLFLGRVKPYAWKILLPFIAGIQNNHKNGTSRLINIANLATGAIAFVTYLALTPVLAQYQRVEGARKFSAFAMAFVSIVAVWELLCVVGYGRLQRIARFFWNMGKSVAGKVRRYCPWLYKVCWIIFAVLLIAAVGVGTFLAVILKLMKQGAGWIVREYLWILKAGVAASIVAIAVIYYWKPEVTYCTQLTEIYGMPSEAGEVSDTPEEMKGGKPYWKIEEYPRRKCMELTYMEPYGQPELMRQYSSAYGMAFFQPTARIEVEYDIDQKKYNSMDQDAFEAAEQNKFREPVRISYYNSGGKLILRMERNEHEKLEITHYSSKEVPQLFNSALLRIPEGQRIENDLTDRRIEVTYYPDGRAKTRRLSPYIYNSYGVNGEYYVYDGNGYLSSLYFLDIDGEFVCNKLGIMRIDFQYEDNGNLHSIRYYSDENRKKKTEGFQGVFCEKFSYDSQGRLLERYQQDRNENLCGDVNGVCMYRYRYREEGGAVEKEEFLGFNGESVRDRRFYGTYVSFHMEEMKKGEKKFIVSTDVLRAPFGFSDGFITTDGITGIYHSIGGQQADSGYGVSGRNQWESQGYALSGYSQWVGQGYMANGQNQQMEQTYAANWQGRRTDAVTWREQQLTQAVFAKQPSLQTGFTDATAQYERQEALNVFQEQHMLRQGLPDADTARDDAWIQVEKEADIAYHYAAVHYIIDKKGDITSISYCDKNGNLMENEEGYAIKRLESDVEKGKLVETERYFDADGRPCLNGGGYMAMRTTYEDETEEGNKYIEYLNGNHERMFSSKLGYACVDYKCEAEDGRKTVYRRYLDQEGEPVRVAGQGYAEVRQYYNDRNFLVWEAYYDKQGSRTRRTDYGVAEIWYEYDDSGNPIRESYKDVDGKLVNRSDTGYAVVYRKFEDGRMVHCRYGGYQDGVFGEVVDKTTGIASMECTYDGGQKTGEEYYDAEGRLTLRSDLGCAVQEFEYDDSGNKCAEYYYGTDRLPVLRRDTGYASVKYQDDEEGKHNAVRFYDTDGLLIVSGKNHCAGISYEYDEKANRATIRYIGTDGGLMVRGDLGYAVLRIVYDSYGNVERVSFFGEHDEAIIKQDGGYFMFVNTYDGRKWTGTRYYDCEGRQVLRKDTGYAEIRNEYSDADGWLVSQAFCDEEGCPVVSTKYGCASMAFAYDALGNRVDTKYYDTEFCLTPRKDLGYAMVRSEYNESGQCISTKYYDMNENLTANTAYHCAGFAYAYDNNKIEIKYIGLDGNPMVRHDLGYAQVTLDYDGAGNVVKESYFDQEGQLTTGAKEGYAVCKSRYQGINCIEKSFYDTENKPCYNKDGSYAMVRYQYDDQGRCVQEQYYDADSQPTINREYQSASRKFAYDMKGNRTDTWYTGLDGELICRRGFGYAHAHSEYDDWGNQTRVSYFDVNGDLAARKGEGYAYCQSEYDSSGNCVRRQYFDAKDNPVLCGDGGYADIRFAYDDYGQCVSEYYFGTKGQQVISRKHQSAGRQFAYDNRGNRIETEYIGFEGLPIDRSDYGYAWIRSDYDEFGNEVHISYYDAEGNLALWKDGGFASCQYVYDVSGNRLEEGYFGTDMNYVCRADEGYACVRYTYNELGQHIATDYFDAEERPAMNTRYRCFGYKCEYDEKGNRRMLCYVDEKGEPAVRDDLGYAYVFTTYDEFGNEASVEYMDAAGQYTEYGQRGYSRVDYEYDSKGDCRMAFYCDEPYHLVSRKDGDYAVIKYGYDEFGQCTFQGYYDDTEVRLVPALGGDSAFVEYEYDERGDNTYVWYYNTDEEVAERTDTGVAMLHKAYDDYGNKTMEECFAFNPEDDGELQLTVREDYNYAVVEDMYDGSEWVGRRYRDTSGNLVVSSLGDYAECIIEYNDARQLEWWAYYDAQGNLRVPEDRTVARKEYIFAANGESAGWVCYDQYNRKIDEKSYLPSAGAWESHGGKAGNKKREEIRIQERQW